MWKRARRRLICTPKVSVATASPSTTSREVTSFEARPVIGSTEPVALAGIAGAATAAETAAEGGALGPISTRSATGGAGFTAATGTVVLVAVGSAALAVAVGMGTTGVEVLSGVSEGLGCRGAGVLVGGTGVLVLIAVCVLVGACVGVFACLVGSGVSVGGLGPAGHPVGGTG